MGVLRHVKKNIGPKKNPTQCFRRKTTDKLRNTGICNSVNNTIKDRTTDGLVVYIGSDCFV